MDQENNIRNTENIQEHSGESPIPSQTTGSGDSSSGVNLLLGLLPLSTCVIQIPLANIFAPLIAWFCVRKDNPESKPAFQGVMNMQISWTLYAAASSFLILVLSLMIFMGGFAYTWTEASSFSLREMVESCETGKKDKAKRIVHEKDNDDAANTNEKTVQKVDTPQKSTKNFASFLSSGGSVKMTSDDGKTIEYKEVPHLMLGLFVWQVVMVLCALLFAAGGIAWLIMTILFAVKLKSDANAKPPLSIRFLK